MSRRSNSAFMKAMNSARETLPLLSVSMSLSSFRAAAWPAATFSEGTGAGFCALRATGAAAIAARRGICWRRVLLFIVFPYTWVDGFPRATCGGANWPLRFYVSAGWSRFRSPLRGWANFSSAFPGLRFARPGLFSAVHPGRNVSHPSTMGPWMDGAHHVVGGVSGTNHALEYDPLLSAF